MNLIIFRKLCPPLYGVILYSVILPILKKRVLFLPKLTKVVPPLSGAVYMKNSTVNIIHV